MTKMTGKVVLACVWMLSSTGAFAAEDAGVGIDWKARLPEVQSAVRESFPKEAAEAHYPASISRTADLTGKGESEALVDLGSGGYTEEFTVVRMEGDKPVVAKFGDKDDKASPKVFFEGFSDGNGTAVKLVPQQHVVFSGHWSVNGTKVKRCGGEAYAWDALSKSFKLSRKAGKELTREFCQGVVADAAKTSGIKDGSGVTRPASQM